MYKKTSDYKGLILPYCFNQMLGILIHHEIKIEALSQIYLIIRSNNTWNPKEHRQHIVCFQSINPIYSQKRRASGYTIFFSIPKETEIVAKWQLKLQSHFGIIYMFWPYLDKINSETMTLPLSRRPPSRPTPTRGAGSLRPRRDSRLVWPGQGRKHMTASYLVDLQTERSQGGADSINYRM